jgi:hypothetical protein
MVYRARGRGQTPPHPLDDSDAAACRDLPCLFCGSESPSALVGISVPQRRADQIGLGGDPSAGRGMAVGWSLCGPCAGQDGAAELAQRVVMEAVRQAADPRRN